MSNLLKDKAELMKEYNYTKNADVCLDKITVGSNIKIWWKCSLGHEWESTVGNRNKGSGCPYCSNYKAWVGYNDLATANPELANEWNYVKNGGVKPTDVTAGSHKKVWWKCRNGHEWEAEIKSRNDGKGCPYCAGRIATVGKNDLQTVNPDLANEWNFERNNGLAPADFLSGSGKKVWWKCSKGHEWQTTISHRANGYGCPYCSGKKLLKGYNDLQTVNPGLAKEWDYDKNGSLKPEDVTANNGKKVWWRCSKGHEWQAKIYHRNNGSGCPVCHSERNTSLPEFALLYYLKQNGIEVLHSYKECGYELDIYIPAQHTAIEFDGYFWHKKKTRKDLEKNRQCEKDGIKLFRIREGLPSLNDSSIDYVIRKDHKDISDAFKAILNEIIGISVDIDLKRDAIAIENLREHMEKENSIVFSNPEIAKEWNFERNGNLRPEHVVSNSGKIVWWKCSKGHEWQARIQHRSNGFGCPYCAGRIAITGLNDLQTVNPDLAKEWDREKNSGLTPMDVLPNSEKKVWWKCQQGHEWQAIVGNRSKGQGCPYCSGKRVLAGYNDLQTLNPKLAQEWDYKKNCRLTPTEVTTGSNKKAWWRCEKGHEWQAMVCDRVRGTGCPYCAGNVLLKGYNDLQTANPALAAEWNYAKNDGLTPENVTANNNKKVWWRCQKGHEWQASIYNRSKGTGCPYCAGSRALKGYNDLQTVNPTLANEWNYEKNDGLTPEDVLPNSAKKVWWRCPKGHEWETAVGTRNQGAGCPYCAGQKAIKGYNDLQTVNPALAAEWDYEKNGGLKPCDVLPNSNKKVWWKCRNGHEWEAVIGSRTQGRGCRQCTKEKRRTTK